jgi:hypothetical protein
LQQNGFVLALDSVWEAAAVVAAAAAAAAHCGSHQRPC